MCSLLTFSRALYNRGRKDETTGLDKPPYIPDRVAREVLGGEERSTVVRVQRRKFRFDFDSNGIVFHIGTNGGHHSFRNPHVEQIVAVTHSDMPGSLASGKPEDLLSREDRDVLTSDNVNAWVCLDLGPGVGVMPLQYSLKHGFASRAHALRNWVVEASADGERWVTLREHRNDTTLSNRYGTSTFSLQPRLVKGVIPPIVNREDIAAQASVVDTTRARQLPYLFRFLRVRQIGLNASGNHRLSAGGLELYGDLYSLGPSEPQYDADSRSSRSSEDLPSQGDYARFVRSLLDAAGGDVLEGGATVEIEQVFDVDVERDDDAVVGEWSRS